MPLAIRPVVWVSPTGDDDVEGTEDAPMRTLSAALAALSLSPRDHNVSKQRTASQIEER